MGTPLLMARLPGDDSDDTLNDQVHKGSRARGSIPGAVSSVHPPSRRHDGYSEAGCGRGQVRATVGATLRHASDSFANRARLTSSRMPNIGHGSTERSNSPTWAKRPKLGPEHQEAHQPTGGGRVSLRPRPGTHPPPGSQEHQTDYHDECDDLAADRSVALSNVCSRTSHRGCEAGGCVWAERF